MQKLKTVQFIQENKAVIRLPDNSLCEPVINALYEGGVKVLQISMTVPDAISLIKEALEFAVAVSCMKQTIPGDFNLLSVVEVEKLTKSGGAGRVER